MITTKMGRWKVQIEVGSLSGSKIVRERWDCLQISAEYASEIADANGQ
jgi:hypothetical protein